MVSDDTMRKTTIEAWTSEWSQRYEKEETLLKGILKEDLMAIHHIGSTSIPIYIATIHYFAHHTCT